MKTKYNLLTILPFVLMAIFTWTSGQEFELHQTLTGHGGTRRSVAFSPDGKTLASGSLDETIKLWRVSDGRLMKTLIGHGHTVQSIAFSPDGKTLASGSWDKTIKLWRALEFIGGSYSEDPVNSAMKAQTAATGLMKTLIGHGHTVQSIAFSPDGKTLASGSNDNTVKLWRVSDGRLMKTLTGHGDVWSVAFSPDGTTLASGSSDNTIKLWRVSDGSLMKTLTGHGSYVQSVAFSPDGKTLASGSSDKTIKLWRVSDGRLMKTLTGHGDVRSVAFSPDGTTLASGSLDETIKLWSDPAPYLAIQAHPDLFLPQDEFETNAEYALRVQQQEEAIEQVRQERIAEQQARKAEKERLAAERSAEEERLLQIKIAKSLVAVEFNPSVLGHYNAENGTFPLTVDGRTYIVKIPHNEAKTFRDNYTSAKVEGYKQLQRVLKTPERKQVSNREHRGVRLSFENENNEYEYFNLVVIHPITGSRFPFGPQKDIAELKYSEPVIATAPDLIFKEPDFVDMDANQVLDAMEAGTLSIKLLNRGDGTAKSVSLSVEVGDPALNVTIPQKFIGEIPPGQSRLITFDLLAGRDIDDGTVSIRIEGKEALGYDARPFPLKIPTAKLIPSQILIEDYFTINDGQTGTANGNNNKIPENGETIEVMLTVRNIGEGPAYGCVLTPSTASSLGALPLHSSIPLGLVAPKSFQKVSVALSIPKTYKKETIDLKLHIGDERNTVDYNKNLSIESSFRQPELSFDYIVHDGTSVTSRGNQNGIIEKGEKIDLEIIPQNLGEYLAEDVAIDVKLHHRGIRPNSTQSLVVGKIPPQSNGSSVSYTFTVQHSAKLGRLTIDVRMEQAVFDTYEKELVFTIEEEKLETFSFGEKKGSGFGYFGDVEQDRLYNVDVAPLTDNRNNNAYAVVIGNRTYGKGVPSVDYAERDARIFKSYLTRTLGFKESNIIYEIDADYGRFTEIFGKKDDHEGEFWGLAKNDDCKVIVYYSGHGAPDLDDGTGYFVPSGSDPNKIKLTGYSVSLLKRNLAKLPTDDITLLIDACFSGGSHREGFLIKDISPVTLKLQDPEMVQGVSVFAASAKDEVSSWYPEARHGVFTYYFLAGLQGRADINQDSIITFSEMDEYLRSNVNDKVREISKGQRKQTPQLQTMNENRVLVRY